MAAGDEARTVIKRNWRIIDAANGTIRGCAGFYDDLKAGLDRGPEGAQAAVPK
jgi:hypothetical protein